MLAREGEFFVINPDSRGVGVASLASLELGLHFSIKEWPLPIRLTFPVRVILAISSHRLSDFNFELSCHSQHTKVGINSDHFNRHLLVLLKYIVLAAEAGNPPVPEIRLLLTICCWPRLGTPLVFGL